MSLQNCINQEKYIKAYWTGWSSSSAVDCRRENREPIRNAFLFFNSFPPPTQPLNPTKAITHMRTHILNHFISSPALYKAYFNLLSFSTIYKQHTYSLRTVHNSVSPLNKNHTKQLHATSHKQSQGHLHVLRTSSFCSVLIIFCLDFVGYYYGSCSPANWNSYLEKPQGEKNCIYIFL